MISTRHLFNLIKIIGMISVLSCTKKDWTEKYQPSVMNTSTDTRIVGSIQLGNEMLVNGTHLIKGYFPDSTSSITSQPKMYVLQSKSLSLDEFIGKKVIVIGKMTKGYPVDYGEYYMEVTNIKTEK